MNACENRAFCGMALFCIYARGRWSDVQHCQSLLWDADSSGTIRFVEGSTAIHKTCRALNLKHSFLPLAAPATGVSSGNWADDWRSTRMALGIENLDVFPMLPAPDEEGNPTVRPVSTSEAGKWLNALLCQYAADHRIPDPLAYTSHSFKATCLSYLAKMGCRFEDRLALGYHSDSIRMALRYSRDGASRPLRVLIKCLDAVRLGRFKPDETRSGRFVDISEVGPTQSSLQSAEETGLEVQTLEALQVTDAKEEDDTLEQDRKVIDLDDHSSSEQAVETCSDSSSDDTAVVMPVKPFRAVIFPAGMVLWQHAKLKTCHLAYKEQLKGFFVWS